MVPGTSVFLLSETGMSGNFEIASRVPSTVLSAQRFVWAAKQPLGNAALGALFA